MTSLEMIFYKILKQLEVVVSFSLGLQVKKAMLTQLGLFNYQLVVQTPHSKILTASKSYKDSLELWLNAFSYLFTSMP